MATKLVYVCSRYSDDKTMRVKQAMLYCRHVIDKGCVPVCPHYFYNKLPISDLNGYYTGLMMVDICSELWVYGDNDSINMRCEIERARLQGKPVKRFKEVDI